MNTIADLTGGRRALVIAAVAGLAAALLAFVPSPFAVLDLFASPPVPEVKAPPPLRLSAVPAVETFDDIAARPLFNAGRKPDPLPPPPEPPKPQIVLGDLTQYKLIGISADKTTQRAIIQKSGGAPVMMKPGDAFEGWTIEKIDSAGVAISGGDRKEVLAIPKAQNRAQSP